MRIYIFALLANLIALPAHAQSGTPHNPIALIRVIERVQEVHARGKQAIVLMDLDDTLINTRERNLRILQDFSRITEIQEGYPREAEQIRAFTTEDIRYQTSDTLKEAGISNPEFTKAAGDFWLAHFFTNEYCAKDRANSGAAKYLHRLLQAGARIIYLTGRDLPRMQQGTISSLKTNFFPFLPENSSLLMKPDKSIDDLVFKKESFAKVATMGEMVAVFENEPANLNAMMEAFPLARGIFLDTIHSPKPDQPNENADWVVNFRLP